MTLPIYLTILSVLIVSTNVYAYTEEENFDYINKILAKLNHRNECQLPSYEEINDLNISFKELEELYKSPVKLNSVLNNDQKLVRETVLDQWESFQKRMTSDVVIRTAKKRSFLCKIEDYQLAKYGFSICIETIDVTKKSSDRIFEKNPIVRYVKHTETNEVINFDETNEVVDTPKIDDNDSVETRNNVLPADDEEEEAYDPLADIPAPPASDQGMLENDFGSRREETPTEHPTEPTTTTTTPLPTLERPNLPGTTPAGMNDADLSIGSPVNAQAEPPIESSYRAEIDAIFEDQHSMPSSEPSDNESKPIDEYYIEDGLELVDEFEDERDLARLDRVEPTDWDYDHIYGEFKWPDEHPFDKACNFDKSIEIRWAKFLKNPLEYKDDHFDDITQQSAQEYLPNKKQQQQYHQSRQQSGTLQLPLKQSIQTHDQTNQADQFKPPTEPQPQRRPRPKLQDTGNLRRRKREFLKSVQFSNRMYESDVNLGMIDEPNADIMPSRPNRDADITQNELETAKSDSWKTLSDNNFCRFSYNRDYISNTRPVQAMKGFLSGNGIKKKNKKSLMS